LLFLTKLTPLSHSQERTLKNCLNCNAEAQGKYCHVCGQENLEPAESLWHLITHFFNDITHFDGKFFSTLVLLLTRPGFLSAEYKMGRRNSYLNPVRMYIFSSFLFFLLFFTVLTPEGDSIELSDSDKSIEQVTSLDNQEYNQFVKEVKEGSDKDVARIALNIYPAAKNNQQDLLRYVDSMRTSSIATTPKMQLMRLTGLGNSEYNKLMGMALEMDSTEFANFSRSMYDDTVLSKTTFKYLADSIRAANRRLFTVRDTVFKDRATYDSLIKIGKLKDNWLKRKLQYREFEINEKYGNQQSDFLKQAFDLTKHYLPQMLFISLPIFAFVLFILYKRNRSFYFVSHGIYSIHLYITYFIVLLIMLLLGKMIEYAHLEWLIWIAIFLVFYLLWYEYKAMRHFYGQRRVKTIFKFAIAFLARLLILIIVMFLFGIISFLKV
jgi:hypothetical protein